MDLIDLSPIKPMLMRSLENPRAIQVFMNYHLGLLQSFELLLLHIFIIGSLLYIAYLLWKNKVWTSKVWKNKSKKERKKIIKKAFLEYWHKVKKPLRKLRYLIIGCILISFSWLLVSLIFYIYNLEGLNGYNCSFSPEENQIFGFWAFLSLIIFLIAPVFIMFCFGNKFIRNIGILIYIFGIFFIALGKFISIGCAGMEQEEDEETEEIETIENFGGMERIEDMDKMDDMDENLGLKTSGMKNGIVLLPDSVEISVKDKVIVGEAVNLSFTIIKGGEIMDDYEGIIYYSIVDEDGAPLKPSEYVMPVGGLYKFEKEDLGFMEFQKGLEIKKEGTFYIEVEDLNDWDENILGKERIEVIKKS